MKQTLLLLVVLIAVATALKYVNFDQRIAISEDLVSSLNSKSLSWKAGLQPGTFLHGATIEQVKRFLGVKSGGPSLPRKETSKELVGVAPMSFDSRTNWPECETIGLIRDQSACGSCWAFGAAEAMSDRMCIFLRQNISLSAADVAFCCGFSCGFGCQGGYPSSAWQYWVQSGVVSTQCYPYPFPSCDHHVPNSPNPCPSNEYPNPTCPASCRSEGSWSTNKHYGASAYSISGEQDIQAEILKNGPVETAFSVYEDFLAYKSGVYVHTSGSLLGGHAVKFVGWGVENGIPYWLVANSWNSHWGDNGYFKIRRGTNECGIESEANAGIPKN